MNYQLKFSKKASFKLQKLSNTVKYKIVEISREPYQDEIIELKNPKLETQGFIEIKNECSVCGNKIVIIKPKENCVVRVDNHYIFYDIDSCPTIKIKDIVDFETFERKCLAFLLGHKDVTDKEFLNTKMGRGYINDRQFVINNFISEEFKHLELPKLTLPKHYSKNAKKALDIRVKMLIYIWKLIKGFSYRFRVEEFYFLIGIIVEHKLIFFELYDENVCNTDFKKHIQNENALLFLQDSSNWIHNNPYIKSDFYTYHFIEFCLRESRISTTFMDDYKKFGALRMEYTTLLLEETLVAVSGNTINKEYRGRKKN